MSQDHQDRDNSNKNKKPTTKNSYNENNNNSTSMINHNCVKFVIWHTLRKLAKEEEESRTVRIDGDGPDGTVDTCVLTHDWKIHFDVTEGDPRPMIARIEADFGATFLRKRLYVENRPRRKKHGDNTRVWRCFESRQKCAGTPTIRFKIIGMGGTILQVKSDPHLEKVEGYFFERNLSICGPTDALDRLQPIPLPSDRSFSLVQVDALSMNPDQVSSDNSIIQSLTPRTMSWEKGEEGLQKIRQSLVGAVSDDNADQGETRMVDSIISIQLGEGPPNQRDRENIVKISQNYIKYQDAIERIVQNSRESTTLQIPTPPPMEELVVHSNKAAVGGDTNRGRHDALESCLGNMDDIVKAMNPREDRIYNLMFATEGQSWSAKFFFQAVPDDVDFTMTLLRFCTLFVHNSIRFQKPKPLKNSRSLEEQIEFLFSNLVRDRFVEETLMLGGTKDGDMSLCSSSFNFDVEDDEVSFPLSLIHERSEEEEDLGDLSEFGDVQFPDRKRLRPLTPMISNTVKEEPTDSNDSDFNNIDVVLRSHLCIDNKYYTAAKLATIGKKLSTGTSNSKSGRLEKLMAYFDARDDELSRYFENDDQNCGFGISGIEFFFSNDANQDANNICVILKGGQQMTIPRRSVCHSKYGEKEFPITMQQIFEERAKTIFENLYPNETIVKDYDGYISGIDGFINNIQRDQAGAEINPCRFALVHDLFREPSCKTEP